MNHLMVPVGAVCAEHQTWSTQITELERVYGARESAALVKALVRWCFLIQLVKPTLDSTKFEVRWTDRLVDDPRGATYVQCESMFEELLAELVGVADDGAEAALVRRFLSQRLIPYEIPVDYSTRDAEQLHDPENVQWLWGEPGISESIDCRTLLLDPSIMGSHAESVKKLLNDKVKIKTYLTDRVLTGDHKTNRESRWETHPESVHFALRRQCIRIEHKLMEQVVYFDGFPEDVRAMLTKVDAVAKNGEVTRCPVTLDLMSWAQLETEVRSPVQGRSNFQVGHLNPLKTDRTSAGGHAADNISWITMDGNRIQGDRSLFEIRALLERIAKNYAESGLVST